MPVRVSAEAAAEFADAAAWYEEHRPELGERFIGAVEATIEFLLVAHDRRQPRYWAPASADNPSGCTVLPWEVPPLGPSVRVPADPGGAP
ncbi:MAG: hypothetical protein NVS3B12_06820 [Acidimicrobiales bacterium]